MCSNRRRRLEGHPLQVRYKQDLSRKFILLLPQTANCPDQMLPVMLLSQHRVSLSKTVRIVASCDAPSIERAIRTWSAVCSRAPHSQFGEAAGPHSCKDK